jgi:hypothetical protein
MRHLNKHAALAAVLAAGLTLFGGIPASADPTPPFTDNYSPACGGSQVGFNPLTGQPIRSAVNPQIGTLDYWVYNLWVCVDTGDTAGAHSVGTAGYMRPGQLPGFLEHTPVCAGLDFLPSECTMVWTGYEVHNQDAGSTGTKPCLIVSKEFEREVRCVSVGATASPSGSPVVVDPATGAQDGEACGARVNGECIVPRSAVHTGGSAATVYAGTTPVDVGVPQSCIGINRPGLVLVDPKPGQSSC